MSDKVLTLGGPEPLPDLARRLGADPFIVNTPTITATSDWQGKLVCFSQACTVTIPSDLPADFSCGWSQESTGAITFAAGAGETLQSFGSQLSSGGQYAIGGIVGRGASIHRVYGQMV